MSFSRCSTCSRSRRSTVRRSSSGSCRCRRCPVLRMRMGFMVVVLLLVFLDRAVLSRILGDVETGI